MRATDDVYATETYTKGLIFCVVELLRLFAQ